MDRKFALEVLGAGEDDDYIDLFEEKLFGIKQYLISKPIVSRLFRKQIEILRKLDNAAIELSILPVRSIPVVSGFYFEGGDAILIAYLEFEELRSAYRLAVMRSHDPYGIAILTENLLRSHCAYLEMWPHCTIETGQDVLIARESDPMELVAAIRACNELGIVNFEDLKSLPNEPHSALLNEWKRLSLLQQKEREWMTSSEN